MKEESIDLNGLTFGDDDDPKSREAFWEGWNYRAEHWPAETTEGGACAVCGAPDAKAMGIHPESQTQRVDWQRGWIAAEAAFRKLTLPGPPPWERPSTQ